MPAVVASKCWAHAEATLRKIEAIARRPPHATGFHPADQRLVHAALIDQVLEQFPHRIIRECGNNRGVQAETTLQPACDVVLSAAFANFKGSRRSDAAVAGVEPDHDLAKTDQIPTAFFFRLDRQRHAFTLAACAKLALSPSTFSRSVKILPDSKLGFS